MPELVTGLAATGAVPDVATLFATAKTESGRKLALRGDRVKYIAGADGRELYDLGTDEHTPVTDGALEGLCRALVDGAREEEAELGRLKAAAAEVADGA